ncbi:MAG: preprotein translocase subunit SecE [Verrucomicrobiales bacterium]
MATKTSPVSFFQQVYQEVRKVSWPTRKETLVTTVMVFIMVAFASLFFLGVDAVISWVVKLALGVGA